MRMLFLQGSVRYDSFLVQQSPCAACSSHAPALHPACILSCHLLVHLLSCAVADEDTTARGKARGPGLCEPNNTLNPKTLLTRSTPLPFSCCSHICTLDSTLPSLSTQHSVGRRLHYGPAVSCAALLPLSWFPLSASCPSVAVWPTYPPTLLLSDSTLPPTHPAPPAGCWGWSLWRSRRCLIFTRSPWRR